MAVHISLADRTGRTAAKDEIHRAEPISGSREQIAIRLRHFEPHVSHVQVVLHPIDVHSVVELAEIARLV